MGWRRERGPKPDPQAIELAKLRRENARLQDRLERAEFIIDFQKRVAQMFGRTLETPRSGRSELIGLDRAVGRTDRCLCRLPGAGDAQEQSLPDSVKSPEPIAAPEQRLFARVRFRSQRKQKSGRCSTVSVLPISPRARCMRRCWMKAPICVPGGRCTVFWRKVRKCRNAATSCVTRQYANPELLATQPNQLWSWDITKLLGPTKWTYYYLYNILDVFSRYSVGWMIAERESAALAEELIAATCVRQGIQPGQLTIHADRGSSMTSKPVALLMADLGVTKTHSRPHVSNDNPFSESQFKTLKYRPDYPERFGCQTDARTWAENSSVGTTTNITTPLSVSSPRPMCISGERKPFWSNVKRCCKLLISRTLSGL